MTLGCRNVPFPRARAATRPLHGSLVAAIFFFILFSSWLVSPRRQHSPRLVTKIASARQRVCSPLSRPARPRLVSYLFSSYAIVRKRLIESRSVTNAIADRGNGRKRFRTTARLVIDSYLGCDDDIVITMISSTSIFFSRGCYSCAIFNRADFRSALSKALSKNTHS